ncbi:UDP-N-acetylmuramate dehydrogenase [Caedibacter taeniospiralis]|uniref:UDP-N-acetylmuramate dehydrogenase n=1 Tax=Caedibacter taeniospiralis TaxID=28907 RepID=UPI000C26E1D3|nr:UDP-N-acetylmuramate dehydrogenase [Caedibacter taeniospiralis]
MFSLKSYNTYQLESFARDVYFPTSVEEIFTIYKTHPRVAVLGNGSNIILSKPVYDEIAFIIIRDNFNKLYTTDEGIYAEAGCLLKPLSLYAYECGLSGVETFFDVPASVGGAMVMNTGAYGDEIYDHVLYVDVLNQSTGEKVTLAKKQIDFGYRYSMFKNSCFIVLGACFQFQPKEKTQIKAKMEAILAQRQAKLPQEPSAGSVFKRPNYPITVGEMVEKIGLKGYQIGGAQISPKHGGVIVNAGNARGEDVLSLIEHIKTEVLAHYQVELELEQIII